MDDCTITKNAPIGAFIIFTAALIIFIYLLVQDKEHTNEDRPKKDEIWISVFFAIIIIGVLTTGFYVFRSHPIITNSTQGKQINKKLALLKEKFNSFDFIGKKYF